MTWYQYKEENPRNGLPYRIRIQSGEDKGLTKTCLWELSDKQLEDLGVTKVSDPPYYNDNTHDLIWNNESKSWTVTYTTNPIKISDAWNQIENFKINLKTRLYERIIPYTQNGGTLSPYFENGINILDNINNENYSNPFCFEWRHPSLIGYTEEVMNEIGFESQELRLINYAFVDFVRDIYIPNQKY